MEEKNYFSFYGLKPKFELDEEQLRKEYLKISRENHPDYFIHQPEKQAAVLQISAYNNKAFSTLKTFNSRVEYLLTISGLYDKEQKTSLPPEFLMEMMEWNESFEEVIKADEIKHSDLIAKLDIEINKFSEELRQSCHAYDMKPGPDQLKAVAVSFEKLKYLNKLRSQQT